MRRAGAAGLSGARACRAFVLCTQIYGACDLADHVQKRYLGMRRVWRLVRLSASHSTSGSNTFKTESQPSPIKSPASHSVPDITESAASQSYVSSLAAAGGSDAYAQSPYHGPTTEAPPPTTVEVPTVTTEDGHPVTTTVVNPDNAGALSKTIPTFLVVVAALGGGAVLL